MPFEHEYGDSAPYRKQIDPSFVRKLLRYDPDEGALYWKPRPMEGFNPLRGIRGAHGTKDSANWRSVDDLLREAVAEAERKRGAKS